MLSVFTTLPALAVNEAEKKNMTPEYVPVETIAETDVSKIVSSAAGLNYRIAKDRRIERMAGYEGMIEIDAYIYQKFDELDKRFNKRLEIMESRLGARLDELALMMANLSEVKSAIQAEKDRIAAEKRAAERPQVFQS